MSEEIERYGVIVADPPWNETGGGRIKRGADRHYPLMKTPQIVALMRDEWRLAARAADKSAAFIWVTNNYLPDGLEVLSALGFRYVTCLTWAKDRFGLGYYFRGQTEHVVFGVKGRWSTRPPGTSSTLIGGDLIKRGAHSVKPAALQDMIEQRFDGPYLEVFARRPREGWAALGNEVE